MNVPSSWALLPTSHCWLVSEVFPVIKENMHGYVQLMWNKILQKEGTADQLPPEGSRTQLCWCLSPGSAVMTLVSSPLLDKALSTAHSDPRDRALNSNPCGFLCLLLSPMSLLVSEKCCCSPTGSSTFTPLINTAEQLHQEHCCEAGLGVLYWKTLHKINDKQ